MSNQASTSTAHGGGAGHSNMAHTPGAFAPHARHASLANSPSGHRRIGGLGPAQHASPSSSPAFPRPFANVASFPGTVSAPRSAAPPNSLSAQHRSIQHLPSLTTLTPTSLAKVPFPADTHVYWLHLSRRNPQPASVSDHQAGQQDAIMTAATSSARSLEELKSAWDLGIAQVLAAARKARARSQAADTSSQPENAGFKRLLGGGPLVYTSSANPSSNDTAAHRLDAPSRCAIADLWLFLAITKDTEAPSKATNAIADATSSTRAQSGDITTPKAESSAKDGVKRGSSTHLVSILDPTVARHLSSDVAKAMARLALLADTSTGSYPLASATSTPVDRKGKEPSLTSEQRAAHKRFMTSLKARAIDSIVNQSAALPVKPQEPGMTEMVGTQPQIKRRRLRLGDRIVFLPLCRDDLIKSTTADASFFSTPGNASTTADGTDQHSFTTDVDLSLCSNTLLVRAISRRLAATPLASTRHAQGSKSDRPGPTRARLLLAPLGCHAEILGVIAMTRFADEQLADLRSMFASVDDDLASHRPGDTDSLASGLAVCTFPPTQPQRLIPQTHLQPNEQPREPFTPNGPVDMNMDLDALPTVEHHEQQGLQQQQQQQRSSQEQSQEARQFLWPVSWCLVLQDKPRNAGLASALGSSANDDLQKIHSQPMTPLKELVSFTLKVLNDANETTFAHNTAPYTPGEPDDASLARNRMDPLSSIRPDITSASIAFPDFDFAMPAAGSVTPSQSLTAAGQSIPSTSPAKREATSTEPGPGAANAAEAFGDDLNWMQFLPQTSEGPASASTPALTSSPAMQADPVDQFTAPKGQGASHNSLVSSSDETKSQQPNTSDSAWAFSMSSASAPSDAGAVAANASTSNQPVAPSSLLQPHGQMHSQASTPFQGAQDTTPLSFAQHGPTKRKAGETDIFGNLGLLTEDDFSFFDESAFDLEPERASASLQPTVPHRPTSALSHHSSFGADLGLNPPAGSMNVMSGAALQPGATISAATAPGTVSGLDDVTMDDIGPNSLDALFSAIPGLQDVMATSAEPSQALHAAPSSMATSDSTAQAAQSHLNHPGGSDTNLAAVSSAQSFHPAMTSFTPRDASSTTSFGDPASLPGFTPSSLTESSPAFGGNPSHKTPRTPYSPVEEYRDGATIVGLHDVSRPGEKTQSYREHNAADQAPDASRQHPFDAHHSKGEDQLRLADASSAAAAAANAAMESDTTSRKRPAIVPNAFLPLAQPKARKPLQRLTAGARANLGRKYDLLGKFASKPKTTTAITTVNNSSKSTGQRRVSAEASRIGGRTDRTSAPAPVTGQLVSQFGPTRPSPSKTPSRRGQALLKLHRDRHSKAPPGSGLLGNRRSSSQRVLDVPATPRSSDDIAQMPGAVSDDDSDSSTSDDENTGDLPSDAEGAAGVTLSLEEQMMMKGRSSEVVASFLRGDHVLFSSKREVATKKIGAAGAFSKPTIRRSLLSRTAEWLIGNPQFRAMFGSVSSGSGGSEVAVGDKIEVLEAMASALSLSSHPTTGISEPSNAIKDDGTDVALPTLGSLVKRSSSTAGDDHNIAQVLEPAKIAVGCQGSVIEALPSALMLWDKSKLSAVSGQKHIVAKVLLTHASPAWHDEIVSWLDRLRNAFQAHGLGTHSGGASSILAVADPTEPLALSSYLDRLWKDGEAWLDTLRSIASRISADLLNGKHVVVYTLQPPNSAGCKESGYHGLLRLEADLRAMLREQVGVLAEQVLVRVVSPEMVTEGGSLGLGKETGGVRRLVFGVYDQLGRIVRRQPGKVLHGTEGGAVSGVVDFPVWTLAAGEGRTKFELASGVEPALTDSEGLILHVSYWICQAAPVGGGGGGDGEDATQETLIIVSAMDERASSSTIDVLTTPTGEIENCIEKVWLFAIAQASRARVRWRLAISSASNITRREFTAWHRLVEVYLNATQVNDRVMGSVALLSVRTDESESILLEKSDKVRPSADWTSAATTTTARSEKVLLEASQFSQFLQFQAGMPMNWTTPFGSTLQNTEEEEGEEVLPKQSAILLHKPRRAGAGHVLAVDLIQDWLSQEEGNGWEGIVESLHRLRLVSEERHQLPPPWNGIPWPQGSVGMLSACLDRAMVVD
ncbi:uncharacterized protein UHO2_06641 [Ustilago hordei]|uniref:Mediator of RNA polymerase II transcription subunit 13 n=1 Tax=Ustilago hordei TaxID=120017 RepID=I2FPH5_USTHO|nr:uncharacterized protein UHO2_06641 [Ustilago hordei]CCF48818.1 uncharacterized protein UHOR_08864 [Ustilago hordei]SYW84989.1 uncharacterized protein UHO2_06641 [Ustilago hordei]